MTTSSLKEKRIAVIGCGGLGCNVCVHLAGMGTGELVVCDFDDVCESNLNRQFFYTTADCGKPKTAAAARFLSAYAPLMKITAENRKIETPQDLLFAKNCDIIILAVDNVAARKTANDFCRDNGIPLVCGGISGHYGNCYLYVPGQTPCLDCAGLTSKTGNTANISSTAGVIGSLSAELAAKYLGGDKSCAGRLFIYDNCEINSLQIKASRCCGCKQGG